MKLDVVIVEKSGELKSLTIKEFKVEELYKKCSFKTESNFAVQTQWTVGSHTYTVYGKKEGKSNSINKYELLKLIAEVYKKEIEIIPEDKIVIDRSLNSERFRGATGYSVKPWKELIKDMYEFGRINKG